jgi:hypothetical protein
MRLLTAKVTKPTAVTPMAAGTAIEVTLSPLHRRGMAQ